MLGKLWPTSSCNRSQSKVTACGVRAPVVGAPAGRVAGSEDDGWIVLAAAPPGAGLIAGATAGGAVERNGFGAAPIGRDVGGASDRTAAV
jgi:hypothetical protein